MYIYIVYRYSTYIYRYSIYIYYFTDHLVEKLRLWVSRLTYHAPTPTNNVFAGLFSAADTAARLEFIAYIEDMGRIYAPWFQHVSTTEMATIGRGISRIWLQPPANMILKNHRNRTPSEDIIASSAWSSQGMQSSGSEMLNQSYISQSGVLDGVAWNQWMHVIHLHGRPLGKPRTSPVPEGTGDWMWFNGIWYNSDLLGIQYYIRICIYIYMAMGFHHS